MLTKTDSGNLLPSERGALLGLSKPATKGNRINVRASSSFLGHSELDPQNLLPAFFPKCCCRCNPNRPTTKLFRASFSAVCCQYYFLPPFVRPAEVHQPASSQIHTRLFFLVFSACSSSPTHWSTSSLDTAVLLASAS